MQYIVINKMSTLKYSTRLTTERRILQPSPQYPEEDKFCRRSQLKSTKEDKKVKIRVPVRLLPRCFNMRNVSTLQRHCPYTLSPADKFHLINLKAAYQIHEKKEQKKQLFVDKIFAVPLNVLCMHEKATTLTRKRKICSSSAFEKQKMTVGMKLMQGR